MASGVNLPPPIPPRRPVKRPTLRQSRIWRGEEITDTGPAAWEDDTHVLVPIFSRNEWSIVRIATDGSMEYAVPPVTGDMDDNPYVLATGGMSYGD